MGETSSTQFKLVVKMANYKLRQDRKIKKAGEASKWRCRVKKYQKLTCQCSSFKLRRVFSPTRAKADLQILKQSFRT